MIRVALVDDDINYRKQLISYLEEYEKVSNEKIHISVFTDGDEIIEGYSADFDIILMDIEMQFMDGMKTAEKIRELDREVVIIFITNMPQYAMKGYMVDALDYVLKPISYYAFSQRFERAVSRLKRRTDKFITIPVKGGMQKIQISKIYYVEVLNHDLIFHTTNGDILTKGSMKYVEELLSRENENFFRCNKCYHINLEYVESITNNDVVVGKDTVQVSRARKKALMDSLNDYMNEVGK